MGILIAWCAIAAAVLIYGVFRYFTVSSCSGCRLPKSRCACVSANCIVAKGHAFYMWRWSQDGWVRKCKFCGSIQYGGDDFDGGPDDDGCVVSD